MPVAVGLTKASAGGVSANLMEGMGRRPRLPRSTHSGGNVRTMRVSARMLVGAFALGVVVLAGCSAVQGPAAAPSPVSAPASSANRMSLGLRRGDVVAAGVVIDVMCQNLTATTMTVPVQGLACVVEAVPQDSVATISAQVLLLNQTRYAGGPSGARVRPVWQAGPGEAVGGSVMLPLAPGEYSVRAHLASDPAIVAVPITVRVPKR